VGEFSLDLDIFTYYDVHPTPAPSAADASEYILCSYG